MRYKKNVPNQKSTFGYDEYFFNQKKDALNRIASPKRKINNWAKAYQDNQIRTLDAEDENDD